MRSLGKFTALTRSATDDTEDEENAERAASYQRCPDPGQRRRAAVLLAALGAAGLAAAVVVRRRAGGRTGGVGVAAVSRRSVRLGEEGERRQSEEDEDPEILVPSVGIENCNASHSCEKPGFQCYEQTPLYAQCRQACVAGRDPTHWDSEPWTCRPLGPRTAGPICSADGADCRASKCCLAPGHTCYAKDGNSAQCMPSCRPGPKFQDINGAHWSCEELGEPPQNVTMGDWVEDVCVAGQGVNCLSAGCCRNPGEQCYKKDNWWGECRANCAIPGWSCDPVGLRTPGEGKEAEGYGMWYRGFPSLYCYSVMRPAGYEVGLMTAQSQRSAGIFSCDEHSLLTADSVITIGSTTSIQFQNAPIVRSVDNTAGNTWLFVHAWDAVIGAGIWKRHSFTLKVDPDAVLLPDRVRSHMLPHVGKKIFVINCPKGDMVFGALEVFSYHAVLEWARRGHTCYGPNNWGEDKYMTHCMDDLGVARVHDTAILADNLCLGSDCSNRVAGAFHPYKDIDSWLRCWRTATGRPQGETDEILFRK